MQFADIAFSREHEMSFYYRGLNIGTMRVDFPGGRNLRGIKKAD